MLDSGLKSGLRMGQTMARDGQGEGEVCGPQDVDRYAGRAESSLRHAAGSEYASERVLQLPCIQVEERHVDPGIHVVLRSAACYPTCDDHHNAQTCED